MITLDLPWPPSINNYYGRSLKGRGHVFIQARGREFRSAARHYIHGQRVKELTGPLRMFAVFHPPDRTERDCDNFIKPLKDAMQSDEKAYFVGVYANDKQIKDERFIMGKRVAGGSVHVEISELSKGELDDLMEL